MEHESPLDWQLRFFLMGGFEKILFGFWLVQCAYEQIESLVARELGDRLGSFTHSMLGKFTWKHQTHGSLDLSAAESRLLVVSGKLASFRGDTVEDIVDEGVHDAHALQGWNRKRS